TEKKKLREKLKTQEQFKLSVINNTEDSIAIVDKDLKFIAFNQSFAESVHAWKGIQPEVGAHISEYAVGSENFTKWEAYFKKALAGAVFKEIIELSRPEKISITEARFQPVRDDQRNIIGATFCGRDITESRESSQVIQEQHETLKKIAWIQSHKVRGPLASILGLVSLCNKNQPDDPLNFQIVDMLQEAALELDQVIHEVVKNTEIQEYFPLRK